MARAFNASNKAEQAGVSQLVQSPPQCMSQAHWSEWIKAARSAMKGEDAQRRRFLRLQVPDYCADCTCEYRAKKHAQGLCHPPEGASAPLLETEDQPA